MITKIERRFDSNTELWPLDVDDPRLPLVAMLLVATVAGQDRQFVFIGGNSQARVIPCAEQLGAKYFVPTHRDAPFGVMLRENRQWIDEMMRSLTFR